VSKLGHVHKLLLCGTLITDVSALGGVRILLLDFCFDLVDVGALGNVYSLSLRGCKSIVDVSALGGVHTFAFALESKM
jgi:hypothetical protein